MKSFVAVLSLLGMASAVDVAMYQTSSCSAASLVCRGLNPDVCCTSGIAFASVALLDVPPSWQLVGRAYRGPCTGTGFALRSSCNNVAGQDFTSVRITTAGISEKRAAGPAARSAKCARPDTLVLGDGTAYDLTGLGDGDFEHLTAAALSAAGPADVPSELKALQI
ncbi:hypothetical protein RB595_008506 [Gaeumannomyces hyphopodioides]